MTSDSTTWDAHDYAQHSSAQLKWARELITKLHLRGDESLLDIGCGNGRVTAEIASLLPDGYVTGIDSSPDMIKLAENTFPHHIFTQLYFTRMDAREINFINRFDIVFSNATLHWVKDHNPVLSGIYRALKNKGRFLLQMGGKGNAADMVKTVESVMAKKNWRKYFTGYKFPYRFYDTDEYAKLIKETGLTANRIQLIPMDMVHGSKDELAGWFRTTWHPYSEKIPVHCRDEFINEVITTYLQKYPPEKDGQTHVNMVRLEVEGCKI